MTLDEIKAAVDDGQTVYWASCAYHVVHDGLRYLVVHDGGSCVGLELDGELQGEEWQFMTSEDWDLARAFTALPVAERQRLLQQQVELQPGLFVSPDELAFLTTD